MMWVRSGWVSCRSKAWDLERSCDSNPLAHALSYFLQQGNDILWSKLLETTRTSIEKLISEWERSLALKVHDEAKALLHRQMTRSVSSHTPRLKSQSQREEPKSRIQVHC